MPHLLFLVSSPTHCTAPHHTIRRHKPHHTTPRCTTPYHTIPYHTTPYHKNKHKVQTFRSPNPTNALVVVVAQLVVRREVSQQRAVNQQHLLVVGASRRARERDNTRRSRQQGVNGCHDPEAVPAFGTEERSRCQDRRGLSQLSTASFHVSRQGRSSVSYKRRVSEVSTRRADDYCLPVCIT